MLASCVSLCFSSLKRTETEAEGGQHVRNPERHHKASYLPQANRGRHAAPPRRQRTAMNELLRHDETPTSKFLANAYYVTMFSAVGIGSLLLILAVLTGRAS
ncbi:hypothetical protein SEA_DUSK_54 [Mycobacterium phage Dusk]|nr:hypothetical protein SEA_DUSK_54 [Mycobacterium phage Dusk]AKQ08053.1 hypothetical protein SEA_DUSK_54 [Mycobacterium phage Dusk]QDK02125.1 hypothetical protein SEA_TOMASZEWSKI_52 [Mycobacterium phage Tomaszewski]